MSRAALILASLAFAACGGEPAPAGGAERDADAMPADPAHAAIMGCMGGDLDGTIAHLDSVLAAGGMDDGYAVRAGCLRQRYVRDSLRADLVGALDDLDRALEEPPSERISPASLWSQRAFVLLTLDPDSLGPAIRAFDRAVAADPGARIHLLDRSTARAMAGDTTGALEDLARVDAMAASDSSVTADVARRRGALGAE